MVVLDTNIIIDHLRRPKAQLTPLRFLVEQLDWSGLAVSSITVAELFAGRSTKKSKHSSAVITLLNSITIQDTNYLIARRAGEIVRDYPQIDLVDAFIAATAIYLKAPLATLNKKHFQSISDLELVNVRV